MKCNPCFTVINGRVIKFPRLYHLVIFSRKIELSNKTLQMMDVQYTEFTVLMLVIAWRKLDYGSIKCSPPRVL